jgi:hypothetical protein
MVDRTKSNDRQTFAGSETSRVEVTIYPNHPSEFDVPRTKMEFLSVPRHEVSTTTEHVVSVSTNKQLGAAAANFEVLIKSDRDLRTYIEDGDWIDITFTRHDEKHHTLRGIVMTIQQNVSASAGPTVATYALIGSEFSLIFDEQQFWFDQVTQGLYFPWIASQLWGLDANFMNGRPDVTVATLLRGFLQPNSNVGAGFWQLPPEMPTPLGQSSDFVGPQAEKLDFVDVFTFVDGYSHVPPRQSGIIPSQFTSTAASVWALAKEFADETLCEFFTDLVDVTDLKISIPGNAGVNGSLPPGNSVAIGNAYIVRPVVPGETHMAVIFRDAPFPNTVRDRESLLNAPYFTLPLAEVLPQHVLESTLARHGVTRKNAFFFGPTIQQDQLATFHDFQLPIVDIESIKHHGIRRFDAESRYIGDLSVTNPDVSPLSTDEDFKEAELSFEEGRAAQIASSRGLWRQMAFDYRDIVRDLHCMNHLLQTGTIALNHGRPDIRIGTRFRILGDGPEQDFTCYVEGVQHSWTYTTGTRTTLTVSHGWTGTDQSYVTKLRQCIDRYQVYRPEVADPQSEPTDTTDTSREDVDSYRLGLAHASAASAELYHPQFRKNPAKKAKAAGDGAPRTDLIRLQPGTLAQEQPDGTYILVTATGEVAAPAQVDDTGTRTVPVRGSPQTAPAAPKQVVVLPTPPKPKPVPQRTSQPQSVLLDDLGRIRNPTQEVLRANSGAYDAQNRRRPTK